MLRVIRLEGTGIGTAMCSIVGGGFEIGSGNCGVGSTTNGSQIKCAKFVLILILIECGRCEAAVCGGGCGIGDGGRTYATGSGVFGTTGSGFGSAIICGSGTIGSSVRTASNSAVVGMICDGCGRDCCMADEDCG